MRDTDNKIYASMEEYTADGPHVDIDEEMWLDEDTFLVSFKESVVRDGDELQKVNVAVEFHGDGDEWVCEYIWHDMDDDFLDRVAMKDSDAEPYRRVAERRLMFQFCHLDWKSGE